ncbi:hypothetical protein [Exiguobacterium sp. s160]|uniref:hypothetical protein n=1 Tax=Exiguobacterium sp. s160 TaxID=2751265 RepID=UPI001BEA8BCC|nr:hypothetical protein [Exiguobacterium sp. s160]
MISLIDTYERFIASGEATRYAQEQQSIEHILQASSCPVEMKDLEQSLTHLSGNPYTKDESLDKIVEHEMKGAMAALELSGYPLQTPLAKAVILSAFTRTNRLNIDKLKELSHADLLVRIQSAERAWKRTYTLLHRSTPTQICDQMDSLLGGCAVQRVLEAIKQPGTSKTA